MTKKATTQNINKRGKASKKQKAQLCNNIAKGRDANKLKKMRGKVVPIPLKCLKPKTNPKKDCDNDPLADLPKKRASMADIEKERCERAPHMSPALFRIARRREQMRIASYRKRARDFELERQAEMADIRARFIKFDTKRLVNRAALGTHHIVPAKALSRQYHNAKRAIFLRKEMPKNVVLASREREAYRQRDIWKMRERQEEKKKLKAKALKKPSRPSKKKPDSRRTVRANRRRYIEERYGKLSDGQYRKKFLAQNQEKDKLFLFYKREAIDLYPDSVAVASAQIPSRNSRERAIQKRNFYKLGPQGRRRNFKIRKRKSN